MTAPRPPAAILGASSGIARALARRLAARGHPLMLASRDADALADDAANLAVRYGIEASRHAWDAEAGENPDAWLDALPFTPGIVVCAVGFMPPQDEAQENPVLASRVLDANFTGPALMLEAAAIRLAAQPGPTAIIALGSVAGDRGRARNYWYGAAKSALETFLSGLRQRHARTPLLVMTVKPGYVATPMTDGLDLPAPLTLTAEAQADLILRALDRRRPLVMHWRWRVLMAVLRLIPERLFARLRF